MSTNWFNDVVEFNEFFGKPIPTKPGWRDKEKMNLHMALIKEEYDELMEAIWNRDINKTVDGAIDLIYVILGLVARLGLTPQEFWDEVHKTNMAKDGGARREDGKILKPEGWQPPDIIGILRKQGWDTKSL